MDVRNALIESHQRNIARYARMLATPLNDAERDYLHQRIAEERGELEQLLQPPSLSEG